MPSVKITGVVSSKCSADAIAYRTDPIITEEIFEIAKDWFGGDLKMSFDGAAVIISGKVGGQSPLIPQNTELALSQAHDQIEKQRQEEKSKLDFWVKQYAEAAGVPVV